jgi:hypothetical protein
MYSQRWVPVNELQAATLSPFAIKSSVATFRSGKALCSLVNPSLIACRPVAFVWTGV